MAQLSACIPVCAHPLLLPAAGIRAIAGQEEPIGRQLIKMEIAEGLVLEKVLFIVLRRAVQSFEW